MDRISIRVEGTLKKKLEGEAARKGTSPSVIIRQLLVEHFQGSEPQEDCLQMAQRLGILGSIKGLPTDLSTNPEHMEGFGRD